MKQRKTGKKTKPEAHWPQRSPECKAKPMKALFSQNTVNAVYKKIFYRIFNLAFRLPWHPIKVSGFDKLNMFVEDYSMTISVKLLSNYLQ